MEQDAVTRIVIEINLSSGKNYRFQTTEDRAFKIAEALKDPEIVSFDIAIGNDWKWFNKAHIQSVRVVEYPDE